MRPRFAFLFCFLCTLALFAQQPTTHGIAVSHLDTSILPGNNFYDYCNGTWVKNTTIPSDRSAVGVFTEILETTNKQNVTLIEEMSKSNAPAGSEARKIADLYNSFMNEAAIEKRGLADLKPRLDAIAAIKDKTALAHALGETLRSDVDALNNTNFHTPNLFGLWVAPGFNDSDHYTPYLLQGGLELPDREYYLSNSAHLVEVRTKYQAHVATMLKLAGLDDVDGRAKRVLDLEHAIAEKHLTLAENDDIRKANNTWSQVDFTAKAPGLDWKEYFRGAGLDKQDSFIVWQPTAFAGESTLVQSQPLDAWKDYLVYHAVEEYAGVLPKALADENFAFFGETLQGTPQQRPRWQRAVGVVNAYLGDALGKVYAQRYFPPEAKAQVQEMVANMIEAFRQRVRNLPWMAASTKAEAEEKLNTLYVGIGYTETWKDYSAYQVKAGDIYGNISRGDLWEYHRQVARIGNPVDRHEWSMTPQTVNAVNLPLQNALNFPAAILQPPFFDPKAPAAANYGAIGTVIGHEISHTFDTEGSAFDSKGRVRDWWTAADYEHFKQATKMLADQYSTYKPFPDLALNGEQTLAENIADVAGISAAFDGYHASLKGATPPQQNGFTGDQQFFIAFGQNWASKMRDNALRQRVLTDPHSPGMYRALTVRNIDAWYPAFNVKQGETLYLAPNDRVKIW
jgi:putative endopeptidase